VLDKSFFQDIVKAGLLTAEQLAAAKEQAASRSDKSLLNILTEGEGRFLSEADFSKFFAQRTGKVFIEKIYENMVDTALLAKVPFKFLKQNVIVLVLINSKIFVLFANPKCMEILDDLELLFSGTVDYGFAPREIISEAINRYYPFNVGQEAIDELKEEEDGFDLDEIKEQDIMEMANDAPIVKLVNHIICLAVKEGASDIHIEPFEKELRVRFRVDGVMHHKISPPKRCHGAIISRVKILANLNIAEKRVPQDGRIQIRVADKSIDLRISVLPCNYGERVNMRILDKSRGVSDLESLSLNERDYNLIVKTIHRPNGIILVSGPTGSGKTTTLYSLLQRLNSADSNIITVEDPVEYTMQGVNQVQVNVKTGLTFSAALRSILRQDPDIALIGEIRDGETAQIATQAALTGHLVLSTIHTNSAPATITRLMDMDIEPFLIASSLICVIAQRLVRALCQACKVSYKPNDELLTKIGIAGTPKLLFYKAVGCNECLNTGYKGRIPLFEVMEITDNISSLIVKRADALEIKKQAVFEGMMSLSSDGIRKAEQGMTTLEEVLSVAFVDG
jgi:general secretion pathway protein E